MSEYVSGDALQWVNLSWACPTAFSVLLARVIRPMHTHDACFCGFMAASNKSEFRYMLTHGQKDWKKC